MKFSVMIQNLEATPSKTFDEGTITKMLPREKSRQRLVLSIDPCHGKWSGRVRLPNLMEIPCSYCNRSFDGRMWIVIEDFNVSESEIEDVFDA